MTKWSFAIPMGALHGPIASTDKGRSGALTLRIRSDLSGGQRCENAPRTLGEYLDYVERSESRGI